MERAVIGLLVATVIALVALEARALTVSGAAVAIVVGTLAVAADWTWGALIIVYFAASSLLSSVGRARKEARTATIIAKSGGRDGVQVLANGALFAGAAAAMLAHPDVRWIALGAGSLAASAADTWATEIGTLARGEPRSVVGWRPVPTGTSGAVSATGTAAMVCGALFVALMTRTLGWTVQVAACVAAGGVAGALVDSLLGGTLQARRWCEQCARETERTTHDCGTPTRHSRGMPWMDNDIVNFLSNAAGGLLAALLVR
ncbi:MAG: DUF92 domain-containing protein [Gemmatimonadaceae bacterium]